MFVLFYYNHKRIKIERENHISIANETPQGFPDGFRIPANPNHQFKQQILVFQDESFILYTMEIPNSSRKRKFEDTDPGRIFELYFISKMSFLVQKMNLLI